MDEPDAGILNSRNIGFGCLALLALGIFIYALWGGGAPISMEEPTRDMRLRAECASLKVRFQDSDSVASEEEKKKISTCRLEGYW